MNINNIISKISDKTKIIFIANPNNPTGSYVNNDEIDEIKSNFINLFHLLNNIFSTLQSKRGAILSKKINTLKSNLNLLKMK